MRAIPSRAPRGRRSASPSSAPSSREAAAARVAVPLVAGGELLGLLVAEGSARVELARAVASQAAVGDQEDPGDRAAHGEEPDQGLLRGARRRPLARRPRRARGTPRLRPRPAARRLVAEPADDALERALAPPPPGRSSTAARSRCARSCRYRAPTRRRSSSALRRIHGELEQPLAVGVSSVCRGRAPSPTASRRRSTPSSDVVLRGSRPYAYDELGPYKYLLRVALDGASATRRSTRSARLAEYDAQRGSLLVRRSRSSSRRHGTISATSEALYVHPNTLRQRLRRIGELSGIDLRRDDWLMIEIAVKMVKLEQRSAPTAQPDNG